MAPRTITHNKILTAITPDYRAHESINPAIRMALKEGTRIFASRWTAPLSLPHFDNSVNVT
jgi:hypothetical protein